MARTKVQSELIATNAISGTIIADGAITSTHLAANCVDTAELVTGSIDTIHIAANQVTAAKIVSDGVETRHLHSNVISGQSAVTAASGDYVLIGDTSDSNNLKKALVSDFGSDGITASGSNTIIQSPDDTNVLHVNNSAKVGIGTSSPTVLLDVYNGSGWGGIDIDGTSGGELRLMKAGTMYGNLYASDSHGLVINAANGLADILFSSGGNTKMTILDSGNVGIGTTSPTQTLDVRGGSGAGTHTHAVFTGTASRGLALKSGQTGGQHNGKAILDAQDTESGGASMDFQIGGTTKVTIDNSGNLAVGNTSPSYKFEVSGTGGTRMMVENTDTNWAAVDIRAGGNQSNYIFFKDDSAERARIQVLDTNDVAFSTGDSPTERMRINNAGIMTQPYLPAFHAYGPSSGTSAADVIYQNTYVNTGNHYSTTNGRFTAPVAGVYIFFWSAIGNSNNDVYRFFLRKNGSSSISNSANDIHFRQDTLGTGSEYATNGSRVQMLALAKDDYVQIYFSSDSSNSMYVQADYANFGGYLLG